MLAQNAKRVTVASSARYLRASEYSYRSHCAEMNGRTTIFCLLPACIIVPLPRNLHLRRNCILHLHGVER